MCYSLYFTYIKGSYSNAAHSLSSDTALYVCAKDWTVFIIGLYTPPPNVSKYSLEMHLNNN
jgi:hypothetical protein